MRSMDELDEAMRQREIEQVFGGLANARRRQILLLLSGDALLSSGQIARAFECSWAAISRHMKVLMRAGLVNRFENEVGKRDLYTRNPRGFSIAKRWLDESEYFRPPRPPKPQLPDCTSSTRARMTDD